MKRWIALLLLIVLGLNCALAEASAAPREADGLPEVGSAMHGFTVVDIQPYASLNAQVVEFVHDRTGAELVWIADDSIDRGFCVAFHTQVNDDKGIPHVFEHSAIAGSEKYPNPNLFFAAYSGTYNTYMNALTATAFTMYPVSSLSEEQLLRYVDFYLDGVYHPLVLTDERSMMREAYRYELESPEDEITLQGAVYSEMLGALTQERLALDLSVRYALPGSAMGSETGGVPGVIETMTQQDLADFHEKYYQPSNSVMFLCGDLDVEPFLELIDGTYLSKYDCAEVDLSDSGYTPLSGDVVNEVTCPATADAASETIVTYSVPLDGLSVEEYRLLGIALEAMTTQGQPFDSLMKERLPGVSVDAQIYGESTIPIAIFTATGAEKEDAQRVADTIREGVENALRDGLDPDLLASTVLSARFANATVADSVSTADLMINAASYWGVWGGPLDFLRADDVLHDLEGYLEQGAFDAVLAKYLGSPVGTSVLVSTSEPGLKERQDAERAQQLADRKAAMSAEEIDALVARTRDFEAWSAESERSVSIAALNAADVAELPEEAAAPSARDETRDGLRVVASPVDSDMARVELLLDASGLDPALYDAAAVAAGLMGVMPTERYGETELTVRAANLTNGIYTGLRAVEREDGSYTPYLYVRFDCFREQMEEAFALVEELLLCTDFAQLDELQALCAAYAPALKQGVDPNALAIQLSKIPFDESVAYDDRLSGRGLIRAMERVAGMDEAGLEAFRAEIDAALAALLNRNGMILTVAGSEENIAAAEEGARGIAAGLDDAPLEAAERSAALAPAGKHIAATYESDAMYNAISLPTKELSVEYSGKLLAFVTAVESATIMPVMRFTYSVYSPYLTIDRNWVTLYAYRDPRLRETFEEVIPSLSGYVEALEPTQEEMDGYITKAYSDIAAPFGPFTGAEVAIDDALAGREPYHDRALRAMRQIKQTTPEDIRALARVLDELAANGARGSVGSATLIDRARDLFDGVDTWLTE